MSVPGSGPAPVPDEIAAALAVAGSRLGSIGCRVSWFDEVGSTNTEALSLAERGADEGWLVGADSQSAGRGRHGRAWASPAGAGLYLSVVLRPVPQAVCLLTLAAGVAVAEGIQAATGLPARVKWPNDVYVGSPTRRKVAGILAEGGVAGTRVEHVVLGIGVNVRTAALPAELTGRATALETELGRPVDRGLVAAEVCAAVWRRYTELCTGSGHTVLDAWRARGAEGFGRRVEWDAAGNTRRGVARDVDPSGGLVVETAEGLTTVSAGEVRWPS